MQDLGPAHFSALGFLHVLFQGWSLTSALPFGIQNGLVSLPAAFQEVTPFCLAGVDVAWLSLELRGVK